MIPAASIGRALISFWTQGRRIERLGYFIGAALTLSGLFHLGLLLATHASWEGPLSLRKAMSFGFSFGLTLMSVTWVTAFLELKDRSRTTLLGAFTFASVVETTLVTLQAWRGVPSHFNLETPVDAMIARTLAAGGIALVVLIVLFTVVAFRANLGLPVSMRVAIRIGFVTLLGALVVGGLMIAKGMLLVFGGSPQVAYATGGALKPTHAVTMHGILVLPALAWLLSFADLTERQRLNTVFVGAAGYLAVALGVAWGNVADLDPSSTPVLTLVLPGALLLAASLFAVARRLGNASREGLQR